jgi:5-methylcytosine-specific restriction endonuclease McrA
LANLLSHSVPNRDLAEVIERAVDLAIARAENRRFGQTKQPRSRRAALAGQRNGEPAPEATRKREHLAHVLRRAVTQRDEMQCAYRAPDGCRCTARAFLQFHHRKPWARHGTTDVENVTLFCQAHNLLMAEQDFGTEFIAQPRAKPDNLRQR